MPRPLRSLAAALVLLAACSPKPPEPPPVAPVEAPPPPPPPKCEALSEQCKAAADTHAKITNSDLSFVPAPGWTYAMLSSATIAQLSPTGPTLAFVGYTSDPKDAKKDLAAREAAVGELVKQLGLTALKRKIPWKKAPDATKQLKDFKLGLWQLDEAGLRDKNKGPLIVVEGTYAPGKAVVGVGFVPDDDKSSADTAILNSVESITKAQ